MSDVGLASVWPCFIHFRSSPTSGHSKLGRMLKGAIGGPRLRPRVGRFAPG